MHFLAHFGNVKKNSRKKIGLKKVHHGARLTEGGGSKAICAMPKGKQKISNRGSPKALFYNYAQYCISLKNMS